MSYLHRDVALGPDGNLHTVVLGHVAGWAAIDQGATFAIRNAVSVRLAVDAAGAWMTYADHETGLTYARRPDGSEFAVGAPVGAYGQAIWRSPTGIRTYVRGGNSNDQTTVVAFDEQGAAAQNFTVPYAPQIHRIDPDGYPVTDTDPRAALVRTIRGVTLYNCMAEQGWICGHADGDVDGAIRGVVVLVDPGQRMVMYPYATAQSPQSPRIAVAPDAVWIGLSNEGTPEPEAVVDQMVPFVPWEGTLEPLPGEPPPIQPPVEPPVHPPAVTDIVISVRPGQRIIVNGVA
jgi:hypothetical protein